MLVKKGQGIISRHIFHFLVLYFIWLNGVRGDVPLSPLTSNLTFTNF